MMVDFKKINAENAQVYCVYDYETRSEAPLKLCGAYEYARHKSTRVLCVAWRVGTRAELAKQLVDKVPAKVWSPAFSSPYGEFKRALLDPTVVLVARNAFFEQCITRYVFSKLVHDPGIKTIPVSRFRCTAARAASLALPRSLEGSCSALGLPVQKDMEGNRLMQKYCKPRKATKHDKRKWFNDASDLRRIMQYCATDVDADTHFFLRTEPLMPFEQRLWELDQKINHFGFRVDVKLIQAIQVLIEHEITNLDAETVELTEGKLTTTNQRAKLLSYLKCTGMPDVKAKTIADTLKDRADEFEPRFRRILEIRQARSKTSTAKYPAFVARSATDGRVRDAFLYHGASTGRWSGRGSQPQNLPKPTLTYEETELAIAVINGPGTDVEVLTTLRTLFGEPMDVFASLLRSMLIPSDGKVYQSGDYAGIEVRVLFWMAGHEEGLKALREGRDLYRELAVHIYALLLKAISKDQREVGKRGVLGAGFGMGWEKFQATCAQFGVVIDAVTAQKAIAAYRAVHAPVPKMWGSIERAAIAAVKNPGQVYTTCRTSWFVQDGFLWCRLPSGRKLAYYGPKVRYESTSWGDKRPKLYHWSVNPKTKKWELAGMYGGRLTQNVVQACARDKMACAMVRADERGYDVALSAHDELLAETKKENELKKFLDLMSELPPWATGLPIKTEGWTNHRYMK